MPDPASSTDPRKRPRQARSMATFDVVLEGAAHILETKGLHGFNTNAVARQAGVSIGSLYQYFPSKEALLVELIRRKRTALIEKMQDASSRLEASDLRTIADGLVRAGIAHWVERPELARSLEYAETTLDLGPETEALKRQIVVVVAKALAPHGVENPETAARDLAALTRGMADSSGPFGKADVSQLEQRVRRAVYGYLGISDSNPLTSVRR